MPIRFHLDESVHGMVAQALRLRHIDVTTPADADLLSASDEEHLGFARDVDRVLVTHDRDFLRLSARGVQHAGIAYCHVHARAPRALIHALLRLSHTYSIEEMRNQIVFL